MAPTRIMGFGFVVTDSGLMDKMLQIDKTRQRMDSDSMCIYIVLYRYTYKYRCNLEAMHGFVPEL